MKYGVCALMLLALLTGCASANFDKTAQRVTAPTLVFYSPDRLGQAAAELTKCDAPVATGMMIDYGVMRDETRILLGQKPVFTVAP